MNKKVKLTWYKPSGKFYKEETPEIKLDDALFATDDENILGARYLAAHRAVRDLVKEDIESTGFFVVAEDINPDAPVGSPEDILSFPELIKRD